MASALPGCRAGNVPLAVSEEPERECVASQGPACSLQDAAEGLLRPAMELARHPRHLERVELARAMLMPGCEPGCPMDELRRMIEKLPRETRRGRALGRKSLTGALVAAAVVSVAFGWVWSGQSEQRAIRAMPDAKRAALYRRTLDDLVTVCAAGAAEFEEHCHEQAEFILKFAECDGRCADLARRQLVRPTR